MPSLPMAVPEVQGTLLDRIILSNIYELESNDLYKNRYI
jgi:hypothetical protein